VIATGPFAFLGVGRPRASKKRTPSYMRRRSPRKPRTGATGVPRPHTEVMIFDHPPAELPVARLRSTETGSWMAAAVRGWIRAGWSWLSPRTVPMLVAAAGLALVVTATHYLRRLATETPEMVITPTVNPHRGERLVLDHEGHHRWVRVSAHSSAP